MIVTPQDWENKYSVFLGGTFNMAHSWNQMLYMRPHNQFEMFSNCYLVGGGTHPGSGLPTILSRLVYQPISSARNMRFLSGRKAVGVCARIRPFHADRILARAREAQPAWAELGPTQRCAILGRLRRAIALECESIAESIAGETKKPLLDALSGDVR